jgi:hypothetical protein
LKKTKNKKKIKLSKMELQNVEINGSLLNEFLLDDIKLTMWISCDLGFSKYYFFLIILNISFVSWQSDREKRYCGIKLATRNKNKTNICP